MRFGVEISELLPIHGHKRRVALRSEEHSWKLFRGFPFRLIESHRFTTITFLVSVPRIKIGHHCRKASTQITCLICGRGENATGQTIAEKLRREMLASRKSSVFQKLTLEYTKRVENPTVPISWAKRINLATKTASAGVSKARG